MLQTPFAVPDLIERIPPPDEVRERLSRALREAQLLRQLLRLAEHAAKDRGRNIGRQAGAPAR
jgi:hypothetical protein